MRRQEPTRPASGTMVVPVVAAPASGDSTTSRGPDREHAAPRGEMTRERVAAGSPLSATAAMRDLDAALADGERSYRALRERLDDYDRRLQAVGSTLRDPGKPARRRLIDVPSC